MSDNLVTVKSYSFLHEAELARTKLEAEGILAFVLDVHSVGTNLPISLSAGIRLQVRRSDLEKAKALLG